MRVDAVLCDAMTVREGLLSVLGGGITKLIRGAYPAPLLADLAAWIEDDARPPPGPRAYVVRVVLRSEVGELGAVDSGVALTIPEEMQDNVTISMPVWLAGLTVPAPGRYFLDVHVNGELLRTLWLRVVDPAPAA